MLHKICLNYILQRGFSKLSQKVFFFFFFPPTFQFGSPAAPRTLTATAARTVLRTRTAITTASRTSSTGGAYQLMRDLSLSYVSYHYQGRSQLIYTVLSGMVDMLNRCPFSPKQYNFVPGSQRVSTVSEVFSGRTRSTILMGTAARMEWRIRMTMAMESPMRRTSVGGQTISEDSAL